MIIFNRIIDRLVKRYKGGKPMPAWALGILQWVLGMLLQQVSAQDVKKALISIFTTLDHAVQDAVNKSVGPFEDLEKQVAVAFHEACESVITALKA